MSTREKKRKKPLGYLPEQINRILTLADGGMSHADIARLFHTSRQRIFGTVKRARARLDTGR